MDISFAILIPAVLLIIIFFTPDLFPKCSLCKRYKLRFFFKLHTLTKIGYGYKARQSACKKCCRKYSIGNLSDLKNMLGVQKKVTIDNIMLK